MTELTTGKYKYGLFHGVHNKNFNLIVCENKYYYEKSPKKSNKLTSYIYTSS